MKIDLNAGEYRKFQRIIEIIDMNSEVVEMYSNFLINQPCFITKELVEEIQTSCEVSEEYAYFVLFAAACGLDMDKNKKELEIAMSYFIPSIKQLETKTYMENSYYKNITIPEVKCGDWELKYESYQSYEAFIYNDLMVDKDFREIPRLGFFNEELLFPAVLESDVEWMTITPNEIETMQPVVDEVEGSVITFGLGLGYFAYMVSEKEQVQGITVVEKNEEVIRLFQNYILPQFPHKDKVEIIRMDAFEYVGKHMGNKNYDYAFVDLWHDVSDGVDLYLKMNKLEYLHPNTKFNYWIEESLLSNLRWCVYTALLDGMNTENIIDYAQVGEKTDACADNKESYQQEFEQKIRAVSSYLEVKNINTFDEITYYLSDSFLKILAKAI